MMESRKFKYLPSFGRYQNQYWLVSPAGEVSIHDEGGDLTLDISAFNITLTDLTHSSCLYEVKSSDWPPSWVGWDE